MSRARWTRFFLWLSVTTWAIALGAKLFDLLVLAGSWGASPPASLALYPYGRNWPINPGDFFQPLSALLLVAVLGVVVSGWKAEKKYRRWLWVPVIAFTIIWIATPTMFWPMINELYRIARGKVSADNVLVAKLVRQWFVYDWLRLCVIAVGFLASVRAISLPYVGRVDGSQLGEN
jgi:hypothetical protein